MSTASVARLESLLRARKLDRTTFRALDRKYVDRAETGQASLDELLAGGFARGHLSEIVGPRSSGRTSLLASVLAAATARGEVVALIDTCDRFDPVSGTAAGLDLSSLLWVRERGREQARDLAQSVTRALKAVGLVLDAGGFGVVALDLADVSGRAIRQIPMTTWMRVVTPAQRQRDRRAAARTGANRAERGRTDGGVAVQLDRRSVVGHARPEPAAPGARVSSSGHTGPSATRRVHHPVSRVSQTRRTEGRSEEVRSRKVEVRRRPECIESDVTVSISGSGAAHRFPHTS